MKNVNLIAAVGKRGQLGLDGQMAWHDPDDLRWFRELTMGHHVVMGGITYRLVAHRLDGRTCWGWGRDIEPGPMLRMISMMLEPDQKIWIAGGARTYKAFLPFVERSYISHIDYNGSADTMMPRLWGEMSHLEVV